MENDALLEDLDKRYSVHQAEQTKQSIDVADCIIDFEELALKEDDKVVEAQDLLIEI